MSEINIAGLQVVEDPKYRYKMPRILTKIEGRGNGIKTLIVNMTELANSLARDPVEVTKFFGIEVGALTICTPDEERYIVNGAHMAEDFQTHLKSYIEHFILCKVCRNPETSYRINKKKELIFQKCKACGEKRLITVENRLTTHIVNLAKRSSSVLKTATAAVALPGADSKRPDADDDDDGSNDDDDDDKKGDGKHHHHHHKKHHKHHHHHHRHHESDDEIDLASLNITDDSAWNIDPSLTVDDIIVCIRENRLYGNLAVSSMIWTPALMLRSCIHLCFVKFQLVDDSLRLNKWFPVVLKLMTTAISGGVVNDDDFKIKMRKFIQDKPREDKRMIKFVKKNARPFYDWVKEEEEEAEEASDDDDDNN